MNIALMVDMQNDFIEALGNKGWKACQQAAYMLSNKKFDYCFATKDWHPIHHMSFADEYENKKPMDIIKTNKNKSQTLWPRHCVQGTKGADLHEIIQKFPDIVFLKGKYNDKEAYSICDEPYTRNLFKEIINKYNYKYEYDFNIYLFGVVTDVCVEATGFDLENLIPNANLYLVENCCAGINEEKSKMTKQKLQNIGFTIINYEL